MDHTIEQNLDALIQKISPLAYVLKRLETAHIRYGLFAGAHVAMLTNNRIPTDVDFLVHDEDLPLLKKTFPFAKTNDTGKGVYLYIGDDDVIEFMGHADITKQDNRYPFRLTELATSHLSFYNIGEHTISLIDPVDTLLLKAILRRGAEQGKHDLEDIEAVSKKIALDHPYLVQRLAEANALAETKAVWQKFGIAVS